jgi:hypothetical protein
MTNKPTSKVGATKVDPKTGNKVEPTTKAKPYGGAGQPGSPDHGSPGEGHK